MLSTLVSGAKVSYLLTALRSLRRSRPSDKVVVFSQFTRMLDVLELALPTVEAIGPHGFARFDGAMSSDAQRSALRRFAALPAHALSVLLVSLQAGGVGLSLTAANHAFMVDAWWNPAIEGQAYDRIHRVSQQKDVFITRIIVEQSVEERLVRVQEDKGALASEALQDGRRPRERSEHDSDDKGSASEDAGAREDQDRTRVRRSGDGESTAATDAGTCAIGAHREAAGGRSSRSQFTLAALQRLFDEDDRDVRS